MPVQLARRIRVRDIDKVKTVSYLCKAMEKRGYLELLELQKCIQESIEDAFPGALWVKAEISSLSPRSNGHCYLNLSQSRGNAVVAECRAMIWKWVYPRLRAFFREATGQDLQAGLTVLVRAQVNYSELYGVSLFVEDIDPAFTLGEQALERKRNIERLEQGGYLEMQKELALPDVPRRLAIISSKTAAGYQDFCRHLTQNPRGYAFCLDLFEAFMQGEKAPASIADALEQAAGGKYDAILILRGGGSDTDLSCYDDYSLAVAVACCPVPVISAIGHDKDVHLVDMTAHESVKTPTALADLFLDAFAARDAEADALEDRIADAALEAVSRALLRLSAMDSRLQRAVQGRLAMMERRVQAVSGRIRLGLSRKLSLRENALQRSAGRISRGLEAKCGKEVNRTQAAVHRLRFAASARLGQAMSQLALSEARIKSTDPRSILALGYVLVSGRDRRILKSVQRVDVGDRIGVRFNDGSLSARVEEVYSSETDNEKHNIA